MLKYVKGAETETIKSCAKVIVNAIANCQYNLILEKIDDMVSWDIEFLTQTIERFKSDNGYANIDAYDVPCKFKPQYADGSVYQQEDIYKHSGGGSYGYEYHHTTDGQPNDLILQMEFALAGNNEIKVILESGISI